MTTEIQISFQDKELEIMENLKIANMHGKTPAFAYDRVSTIGQELEGYSLENQKEASQSYADKMNMSIIYTFTIAESAWKVDGQKVFSQMIELSKKYRIHNLIFKCVDRMSRNLNILSTIENLIDDYNYSIHFWENNKCINKLSDHNDKMIIGIQLTMAKYHSDKVSNDVRQANKFKVSQGIPLGNPPIGYIFDRKNRIHIKDPEKNDLIQFIFNSYDNDGLNLRELRDKLNEFGYKSSKGTDWSVPYLHHILRNPFYAGYFYHDDILHKAKHETYITYEQYESRINKMSVKNKSKRRSDGNIFPYSGIIRCGDCKRMMTGELKKERFMYWSHLHNGVDFIRMREIDIIEKIDIALKEIALNPSFEDIIMQYFKDAEKIINQTQGKRKQNIQSRIGQIEAEQMKLLGLFAKDFVNEEILKEKMIQYDKEKDRLAKELKSLFSVSSDVLIKIANVVKSIRNFHSLYLLCENKEKGELLKSVVEAVYIFEDSAVIEWNAAWKIILDPSLLKYKNIPVIKSNFMLPR